MTPGRLVVGTKGNVMTLQAHLLTSRPTCHAPDTRHGWIRVPQLLTVLCLMTWGWMSPVASASTSCVFISSESTLRLTADCTTNSTLYIPEGFTLDGQGFTITAVNPSTGSFQGAVIQNAGKVAHVVNVGVRGSGILNTCAQGEARLKGISLYKASGSILNSRVEDLHRGASSCEEGNAIDVSNPPYDGSHPATLSVTISGNSVDRYQKTGIAVNGDVSATVSENAVGRAYEQVLVASNSIQVGYGAKGALTDNQIEGNEWNYVSEPQLFATAILVFEASQVQLRDNVVEGFGTDVGAAIFSSSNIHMSSSALARVLETGDSVDEYGVGLWLSGNSGPVRIGRNTFDGWNESVRTDKARTDASQSPGQSGLQGVSRFIP